jgi:hypothetical protein
VTRTVLVVALFISLFRPVLAQTDSADINIKDIHYEPITQDYFSDYKNAKLIINYYCADGWSVTNRYSYEVVIIDSMLMLGFDSPETESMRYISYEKKMMLSGTQVRELEDMLDNANLTQEKTGIPRPDMAANTKEVLIVRYKNLNIAGGMFHYNVIQEDRMLASINAQVQHQRKITSSIGGNYDLVIQTAKSYFKDLNELLTEELKIK